ncbi:hypothetical protein PtA15_14A241 [Puccinia triticina]|uniref:Uncharacterized protein n=1 Tax=Puccinia triticina TaxID=208348 RepID=A0ABY7D1A7_9BASI|nr:uncharacterized protein PtA15_14A241 [Puccinia triticina]WAQ91358.1 hypothetical protein PtA15_14A241 [Puccinia triticina]
MFSMKGNNSFKTSAPNLAAPVRFCIMRSKEMWETLVSGNSVMMEFESGEDRLEEEMLAQEQNDFELVIII